MIQTGFAEQKAPLHHLESEPTREEIKAAQGKEMWCTGCGVIGEQVLSTPDTGQPYCPRCASMHASGEAAVAHLGQMIGEMMPRWKAHWVGRGCEEGYLLDILVDFESTLLLESMPRYITEAFKRS